MNRKLKNVLEVAFFLAVVSNLLPSSLNFIQIVKAFDGITNYLPLIHRSIPPTPTSTPIPTLAPTPIETLIPTATTIPNPTSTSRPKPTSTPSAPITVSCSTSPSQISVGYGGTLNVYASLYQGGSYAWVGALTAEWNDGNHTGYCSKAGSSVGPISCQGHYWPLPGHRTVIVQVGVNSQDGRRFNCQTSYFTP